MKYIQIESKKELNRIYNLMYEDCCICNMTKKEKWDNLISAIMQKYIMKTGLIAGKPHNTQLLTYSRNIYKGEG